MSLQVDVHAETLCVGGIDVQLYRAEVQSTHPVAIVYLLHGRLRSKEKVRDFARKLVLKGAGCKEMQRTLWVVTFVCPLRRRQETSAHFCTLRIIEIMGRDS